mmetsp:Transcript_16204/g.22392  ORF Transcript_16204/g.22392 Transcript_16204/m.22392 type:complete len:211 (+) Transcript_16204:2-634(+)
MDSAVRRTRPGRPDIGARSQTEGFWGRREEQCFRWFNPLTQSEYNEVVSRWVSVFLMLAHHVAASLEGRLVSADVPLEAGPEVRTPKLLRGEQPAILTQVPEPRVLISRSQAPRATQTLRPTPLHISEESDLVPAIYFTDAIAKEKTDSLNSISESPGKLQRIKEPQAGVPPSRWLAKGIILLIVLYAASFVRRRWKSQKPVVIGRDASL